MPVTEFPLVDIPDSGGEYIGAVGNLISAALQTAGLYFQSDILNTFVPILQGLGVLIFIFGVGGAISTFVITGEYKRALFFLLSPSLFWMLLMYHSPAEPTRLQVGSRVQQNSARDQLEFLNKISGTDFYTKKPEVSWFFAKFDNLVSSIVQGTVSVLIDEENKKDLIAVARERVLAELFSTRAASKDFVKLISLGILGECAELSRRSAELSNNDTDIKNLRTGNLPDSPPQIARLNARNALLRPRIEILKQQTHPLDSGVKEYIWSTLGGERIDNATCGQIWEFTRQASMKEADQAINTATSGQESVSGIPWDKVKVDVEKAVAKNQPDRLSEIVGAYIFKNTMQSNTHTILMNQLVSHSPLERRAYQIKTGILMDSYGQGELLSTQYFAGVVPYIQGLLLFILSGAFPFFCLLVLVPSRMPSIFVWCGMWVWVKSWDVGFALIQFVRELLWSVFSRNIAPDPNLLNWSDLSSVFDIIAKDDHFVSLGLYNSLLALLTISVPFVTAHLCLGGTEIFSAFRTAIDKTVSRVSSQHTASARRRYATVIEGRWRQEREHAGLERANKAINARGGMTEQVGDKKAFERWQAGDGTMTAHVQGEYMKGMADFDTSARSGELLTDLAATIGRPVVLFNPGNHSNQVVGALVNTHNERHLARPVFDAHGSHIGGSLQKALGIGGSRIYNPGKPSGDVATPVGGSIMQNPGADGE